MSDNIQNQETLKEYCLKKYEELLDKMFVFTISERDTGRKKWEEYYGRK